MSIEATIGHNGLIWVVIPEGDLPRLITVLTAGLGTIELTTDRDDGSDEWRRLKAMLVEPSEEDKLDFQLRGNLVVLTGDRSALSDLASALTDLAADPRFNRPGMRQLRLVDHDNRLRRNSSRIVLELG